MSAGLALAAALAAPQAAPMPEHEPGDAFVYSDGRVERLIEARGERARWGGLGDATYWRARSPFLPILEWSADGVSGRRKVLGEPDRLWPLAPGRSVRFTVVTETRKRSVERWDRSVAMWSCRAGKRGVATVPAGVFEIIPVHCDRHSTTTMKLVERQSWDYAPELRHYVRRTTLNYARAETRTIELVAALHGPAATRDRLRAIARSTRAARP